MSDEYTLHLGDSLAVLATMPDNSIDAIVTDPPYGLGREPDALEMLRDWLDTGHHEVKGSGFMGKTWDAFVPQPVLWRQVLRVLKPGGHVLAFAGTRTMDLMTLGLRIAGFELRDAIGHAHDGGGAPLLAWTYSSGFPKSLNVSKAMDRSAGALMPEGVAFTVAGYGHNAKLLTTAPSRGYVPPAPATPAAARWQGWGTALKPAWEPIILARKPLGEGTVAANVLKWGTGAVNVDGCRVGTESTVRTSNAGTNGDGWGMGASSHVNGSDAGRWPANVVHDGSPAVVGMFPNESEGDSGSAARFFYCAKASRDDREAGLREAGLRGLNASPTETGAARVPIMCRNHHPTVKPTDLMRWLVRLITPPGGTILDPFMGSGSTGKAAILEGFQFVGVELSPEYVAISRARIEDARLDRGIEGFLKMDLAERVGDVDVAPLDLFAGGAS